MTSSHSGRGDDAYWRRPPDDAAPAGQPEPAPAAPAEPVYAGPPRAEPPPRGWRTPTVVEPLPARELPRQDLAAIEAAEYEALKFTYGVGMLAGAVLLVMLIVICARLLA